MVGRQCIYGLYTAYIRPVCPPIESDSADRPCIHHHCLRLVRTLLLPFELLCIEVELSFKEIDLLIDKFNQLHNGDFKPSKGDDMHVPVCLRE